MSERFANAFSTTLTAAIDTVATSIAVATAAPAALQGGEFRILVGGGELMLVTATGSSGASPWTVQRAAEVPSVAMSHASGATVEHVLTAASLSEAVESGSGLPSNILTKTANFTAADGDFVLADATGGAFTITLPASGTVIVVKTDASANAVAVAGTINGDAGGLSLEDQDTGAMLASTADNAWRIVAVTATGVAEATAALDAHIADATAAHAASAISFTPVGTIAATNAQAAVAEVATDAAAALTTHTGAADPHGDRAYADGLIAANDALVYKGAIDASTNPNYPAASAGHAYKISVAGKIGGASGTNVELGDTAICTVDGTAAGTQAAVGANWSIIQTNIDGAVVGPASAASGDLAIFSGTSGKLIAGSGATPSNDDLVQRKAGAWTNRTPAQVKTDLVLVKADVGLGNVDNTSDASKPVSTAQAAADTAATAAAKGLPLALTGATAATRFVGGTAAGAPASGTFAVGDFVIDQTAKVYICTAAGTPGTWVQVGGGGATDSRLLTAALGSDFLFATSSTTQQDVTGLAFAIGASATEVWVVEATVVFTAANTNMDIAFSWSVPASASMRWGPIGHVNGWQSNSAAGQPSELTTTGTLGLGAGTANGGTALRGIVRGGGTAGNVQLRGAQNASDAGQLTLRAGTCLVATRVVA